MDVERRRWRIPGSGWLEARLTRKMVLILLGAAVLGWLMSIALFLRGIGGYVENTYDAALNDAEEQADQIASFLAGSQGDLRNLEYYLSDRDVGCSLQDSTGQVIFQRFPRTQDTGRLTISDLSEVELRSGETLSLRVWVSAMDRQGLKSLINRRVFSALILFNLSLFAGVGVLLYLLIVSPIVSLRRTMRTYSEKGTLPPRSTRFDEVGRLQNTFADLTGVLQAKEQSERRLIASISHDIKTPLTSVLGYSQRLLSAQLKPETQTRYLQSIHDKGLAIKSIVDEFDDYLDAGLRDEDPMELARAQQLCDSLRQEYEDELADAGVRFTVRCLNPEAQLIYNPAHMRRCFGNLIGNSIRHSGAANLELELTCRRQGDQLALDFADNGKGVPEDLRQAIFEPLYTSDRGRKVSGLGLAICKSIVTAHGGTIAALDRVGGGLLIRICLPCVQPGGQ